MTKQIPLSQGKFAIVDDDVYEWASKYKWCAMRGNSTFYALRGVGKRPNHKKVYLHRDIMDAQIGVQVDHINGDGLDNRRENLRLASNMENQRNRRLNANNTSGFKGVYWQVDKGKWRARIEVDGNAIHLGYFDSKEDAALAYDASAIKNFGEFAKTNF